MMIVEPAVLANPFVVLSGIVWRVGGPFEVRTAALPVVADGATNYFLRMGTQVGQIEIEARMRGERMV